MDDRISVIQSDSHLLDTGLRGYDGCAVSHLADMTIQGECGRNRLLHGDGLGEVAGLVDVAASSDADVVGEELHGHCH